MISTFPEGLEQLSPEASSLYKRDHLAIAGIEKLRFFPLALESARGSTLVEAGGRELIDLTSTWTAAGLGYGHPKVTEAVTKALQSPAGMGLSLVNPEVVALAEELLEIVPGPVGRKVYIGHSGSDACDVALRAVRFAFPEKHMIAFRHSYHGGLGLALGASGVHVEAGNSSPDPKVIFVDFPNPYRPTDHDPSALGSMEHSLSQIRLEFETKQISCVIVEPILDDGGLVIPPSGFLKELEAVCHKNGALLVCDEVKVGLGRTGLLHAFQHDGVTPDITCFGKSLGNGIPISATIGPPEILDHPTAATLLTTAGNPISASAARAVLKTIKDEELPARADEAGKRFIAGLKQLSCNTVGEVRGKGLAIGVELVSDRYDKTPAPAVAAATSYRAFQLGVAVFCVGSNVLEITPPLVITDAEIDRAIDILGQAISDAEHGLVPPEIFQSYTGW